MTGGDPGTRHSLQQTQCKTPVSEHRQALRARSRTRPAAPCPCSTSSAGFASSATREASTCSSLLDSDRESVPPKAFGKLLLARPERLTPEEGQTLTELTEACPEITRLADHIGGFTRLLEPAPGNAEDLTAWIADVREDDPPRLHAFTRGLDHDRAAVDAVEPPEPEDRHVLAAAVRERSRMCLPGLNGMARTAMRAGRRFRAQNP